VTTRKKIGSGESLPASDFAYVGDPDRVSTWKFPIHDKSHVQNAVARFNQTDLTGAARASAKRKIRAAYRRFFPDNEIPNVIKDLGQEAIQKATEGDKRMILSNSIYDVYKDDMYAYLMDYDDQYVYFEAYTEEGCKTYRDAYTFDGTSVTFDDNPVEVVRQTEYEVVESAMSTDDDDIERSLLNKMSGLLDKYFGGSNSQGPKVPVIKQFDSEQMISIEPLYIKIDDVDGVGDAYYDADTCYQMVDSLNKAISDGHIQANYFHKIMTEDFSIEKAWVNECDCMIGESLVPEGLPLVKLQFHSESAWELRKSGELMGVSIGAKGEIIEVEEDE
jgi:hypothetical protein